MLFSGRIGSFAILVLFCAIVYVTVRIAKTGKMPGIRKLPALDAIEEAVGRAAEMGKGVFFNSGQSAGGLSTIEAPIVGAAMALLGHTARLTARYGVDLSYFLGPVDTIPVAQDVIRTAYVQEGMEEAYKPTMVRWLSDQQMAYSTGIMGAFLREKPAAHIMMGGFWFESILLGEAGKMAGAFTVGGTPRQGQVYFLVAICDYVLIGDEYYAAEAYLTKDPDQVGTIWGEDYIKVIIMFLLLAGSFLQVLGIDWIKRMLTI